MEELVSVIINVYNREKFIGKCLESVINQTYKNLEILIINDGSTDNTLKICESYKDDRIRIISTENKGLSESRNIGIENAKGDYLYFVDSDDYIKEDVIEYLYNLCKKYDVDFSTCLPLTIYDYNFKEEEIKEDIRIIDSKEMLKKVFLGENNAVTIWNKLMKKHLFDGVRFEDRIINDMRVTHKVVINAGKIAYSNQKKYYYLKHKNAITVSDSGRVDRSIDLFYAVVDRYNYVKNIYPDFLENDVGLLRYILKLYLVEDEEMTEFLKKNNARKYFDDLFSCKMIFSSISLKLKIFFILFKINPKLCRYIGKKYEMIRYRCSI